MGILNYACEKFGEAERELVVGPDRIKERLQKAAESVALAGGAKRDMPPDLIREYEALWAKVTRGAQEGAEGAAWTTIAQMSEEDAGYIAFDIVALAERLRKAYERADPAVRG